jgi:hypothetical protein
MMIYNLQDWIRAKNAHHQAITFIECTDFSTLQPGEVNLYREEPL